MLLGSGAASADVKVLERSAKKAPEWITGGAEGYIIAAVEAPSIADARTRAEQDIAAQMVMTIARNVNASYSNESSEVTTNAGVDSRDSYSSTVAVQGANLPFIKGISLSKAEAVYWVKVQDKATKAVYYQYYVKYPFFRVEQQSLMAEFDAYDKGKEAELAQLEADIDSADSMDAIHGALAQLESLQAYFFDKVRAARVKGLATRYRELPGQVQMVGSFADAKTLIVSFLLGEHAFNMSGTLKATSNCASNIQVRPDRGGYRITFSTADCIEDEDNYIDVLIKLEGRKLTGRYSINEAAEAKARFAVNPTGTIVLNAAETDAQARTVAKVDIRLSLNNRGGLPFGVKSLELNVPTLKSPLIIDNIDAVYSSKGIVQLTLTADATYSVAEQRKSAVSLATGTLTLVNAATQAVEPIRLSLPYRANWE